MSFSSRLRRLLIVGLFLLGACGGMDGSADVPVDDSSSSTSTLSSVQPLMSQAAQVVASCDGTPGGWEGCRGHGCAVCGELTAQYPYYFVNHPLCDRNLTCDGQFATCNAHCPAPTESDKEPSAGSCNGTAGQWDGCRGNGCAVCAEKLTAYPYYFLNHRNCVKNSTCAGQSFTCSADCPAPTVADQAPPAGTCSGTAGQWQGCRGNGCAVCAEKLSAYPAYFQNHPNCVNNTTCAGQFGACNSNCPAPTDADRAVAAVPPSMGPTIKDLPAQNTALTVETSAGVFRIASFPTTSFNVINVVIASADGQPLAGQVQSGGGTLSLQGTSQTILFRERATQSVVFALALPSARKVTITWSVADRVPASKSIDRTTSTASGVITAKYAFTTDHAVDNDLSMNFTAANFSDGAAPTFKRLEHNLQGVRYPDRPNDVFGPTYDIHASPKSGKLTQVALPVPEVALMRDVDLSSISIMHYNASTKAWTEIKPDKVSGGYVYFTTSSFSSFFGRMLRKTKNVASDTVSFVADGVSTFIDGVTDTIKQAYTFMVSTVCSTLDFSTYKRLFYGSKTYSPPKLDLADAANSSKLDLAGLQKLVQKAVWKDALDPGAGARLDGGSSLASLLTLGTESNPLAAQNELEQWWKSSRNAELLMADVILAARSGGKRRFAPKMTQQTLSLPARMGGTRINWPTAYLIHDATKNVDYDPTKLFRFSSALLAVSPRVLETLVDCSGMLGLGDEFSHTIGHVVDSLKDLTKLNLSGACQQALMLPADALEWVTPDLISCAADADLLKKYYNDNNLAQYWGDRDRHALSASEFLNQMAILFWADPQYRDVWRSGAGSLRDQMHSFLGLTHDMYGNGNIPIKLMAGVALWDMVSSGDKTTFGTMKSWLEAKMGEQGGYAEGTGYLQYINEDVAYVMATMLRGGLIDRKELPQKYLKSAEWLLAATPVMDGAVTAGTPLTPRRPVEVDDGVTRKPDFQVYAYLTGDARYLSLGSGDEGVSPALRPLGLTSKSLPTLNNAPVLPDVSFVDGVGMVRAKSGTETLSALSVVAESGLMRTGGNGHDQQDNGSVTLVQTRIGEIIADPGYAGFSKRHNNPCLSPTGTQCLGARFDAHNVVMTADPSDFHGEKANGLTTFGDVLSVLRNQPDVHNLDWAPQAFIAIQDIAFAVVAGETHGLVNWTATDPYGVVVNQTDAHAGGADAGLLGALVHDLPPLAVHGLEVKHTSTAGVTNRRFLANFADQLLIIDRPDALQPLWSRLNWFTPADFSLNALEVPSTLAEQPVQLTWPENAARTPTEPAQRTLNRRTHVAGSATDPAVFLTLIPATVEAIPVVDPSKRFGEIPCNDAVCAQRGNSTTAQDLVVIPKWGRQFKDCRFFSGMVATGQIVFAHRDSGSPSWTVRLLGDEPASAATGSLGTQVQHDQNVLFTVTATGVTAVRANGQAVAITAKSACTPTCTAPFNDQWTQSLGAGGWSQAFGDPLVDVANNRLRLSQDDVVQRNATLGGSYTVSYDVTLSGGTTFTPAVYETGTFLASIRRNANDMQFGGADYGNAWSDTDPAGFAAKKAGGVLTARVTSYVKAQSKQMAMKVVAAGITYRSGWSQPITWAQTNMSQFRFIGQNLPGAFSGSDDFVYVGPLSGCSSYADADIDTLYDGP